VLTMLLELLLRPAEMATSHPIVPQSTFDQGDDRSIDVGVEAEVLFDPVDGPGRLLAPAFRRTAELGGHGRPVAPLGAEVGDLPLLRGEPLAELLEPLTAEASRLGVSVRAGKAASRMSRSPTRLTSRRRRW
jgi:hypothetical protein